MVLFVVWLLAMKRKLGEILLERKLVTACQLGEALETQVIYGGRLGRLLVQFGFLRIDDLGRSLSTQHGVPHAEMAALEAATNEARQVVDRALAARYNIIPMALEGDTLHLAMAFPERRIAGELSYALNLAIERFVAPELRIKYFLERYYGVARSSKFLRQPEPRGARRTTPAPLEPAAEPSSRPARDRPEDRRKYLTPNLDWDLDHTPISGEEELQESMGIVTLEEYHRIQSGQHPPVQAAPPVEQAPAPQVEQAPAPPVEPAPAPQVEQAPAPRVEAPHVVEDAPMEEAPAVARDAPPVVVEIKPAVRARSALDLVSVKLETAITGGEIARLLVEPFMDSAVTSILFWVKDSLAMASHARGVCVPDEDLGRLVISLRARSVLQYAHDQRVLVHGLGEGDPVHAGIARRVKVQVPEEVCIAPLLLRDKVIGMLYISSGPVKGFPEGAQLTLMTLIRRATRAYMRLMTATSIH